MNLDDLLRMSPEQLEIASWLISYADSSFHQNKAEVSQLPAEFQTPGIRQADYHLAARYATNMLPAFYVMYVSSYQTFYYQPRCAGFAVLPTST